MFAQSTDLLLEPADRLLHVTMSGVADNSIFGLFADGSLYVLKQENASLQKTAKPLITNATAAAAHPFLNLVAVGCGSGVVYLAEEDQEALQLTGHVSEIMMLKWISMGRALAVGDASGRVQVFQFDPATRQTQLITKISRKGKPIGCFERTACTQNFFINIPAPDGMDRLSWMIGNVPLELLVGFDSGDVVCLQEKGGHQIVCNISTGIFQLFYWPENDTGAAISPSGDLVTFGFESLSGHAKKVNLNKSKLEFALNNGVCQLGNCKLAYVSTTGGQVKIIDIFTQIAQIIEIDDFIDTFTSINGEMFFLEGLGLVIGTKGSGNIIIISEKDNTGNIDRFSSDAYNSNYVHLLDMQLQDNVSEQNVKVQYTVKDVLHLHGEFADTFMRIVQNDAYDLESPALFVTSRTLKHPADGTAQPYILIQFKKPIAANTTQINSSLLQQSLNGEALVSKNYLESSFAKARSMNCQAVQTDQRNVKVFNEGDSFQIGVGHDIEKLCLILTANEKSGYLLVYGKNTFSTFELNFGAAPQLIETFELPVDDYEVHDVALFGRHIIASVNTRFSPTEAQLNKSDVLRMTMNGTISHILPINYQQEGKAGANLKMTRLQVVNFHLFMVSNSQSLYYTDMKNFNKVIEIARLVKDYVLSDLSVIKSGAEGVGPEVSVSQSLRQSFSLSSLQVSAFNATCTLESIQYVNMCFQFVAFNELLGRYTECPFCLCLQVNVAELFQSVQSQIDSSTSVKNSRVVDFAPHKLLSCQIDCFDNLAVETQATNNYMFLLVGFSSALIRRYCIFHRQMLLFDNCIILRQIMDQITDYARVDDESAEQNIMMNGLDAMLILQFLSIKTQNQDRERIIQRRTDLMREGTVTTLQGVFQPYIIPKIESQAILGTMLQFVSPALILLQREAIKSIQLSDNIKSTLALKILSVPSLTLQDPFAQSPKTTYTMSKFIVSVQNNRFNDAYQFVAKFDSVEIWRTLAQLCVKNGYIDLLRTCISHLKSPMVSLILRGQNMQNSSGQQASKIESSNKDQEMAALLSISLGDINTGMGLLSNKPLLNAKIMQQVGLGAFNISDQAFKQTTGFHAITRKASVYGLANRLYRLGDYSGANCCYSEIFQGENVYVSDLAQQKKRLSAEEEQDTIKAEFDSNGAQAAALLAKKMNTIPSLYKAAALVENKAYDDQDQSLLFEAAQLYNLAGCKTHALQCAIQCETDDLVHNIGVSGGPRVALQAAAYFARKCNESEENMERALLLYSGAGYTGQAVELCLQTNRVKELAALLNEMLSGVRRDDQIRVSNELLSRAGSMLVALKQADYALDDYNFYVKIGLLALAHAGATDQALQVIASGQVLITEDIADLLTPSDVKAPDNVQIISTIGKLLFKAELYQQAVQKFILINDSYLALNALIKLGNVEKVVKFAQMSRDKKCFVAAGNFLQTQNFRDNLQFMTWIIQFYQKAGALDYLIKFFMNCAAEEIDVFNDYEKAMEALREAAKWIGKNIQVLQSQAEGNASEMIQKLQDDKSIIERNGKLIMGFLNLIEYARNNLNDADAAETLTANAKKLIAAVNDFEQSMVQIPHILAFMCEFHAQRGENARVLQILKNMQGQSFDIVKYVDEAVIEQFAAELGITAGQAQREEQEGSGGEGGEESAINEEEDVELDIQL